MSTEIYFWRKIQIKHERNSARAYTDVPRTDTGMGLAVPKRPHALLAGVCKLHEHMSGTLASAACALEQALVHPEAVHAVFSRIDATLSRIDGLMHAFFQDAKAGQLAQAVVLERAVEELACARVARWLQQGSVELPSIMEAKHELEHAAESVHQLLASYNELCFRLHGLTDALWRACYDQVPAQPACTSLSQCAPIPRVLP